MMKNNGIKISSYFINEGNYGYGDDKNVFSRMYGRDASFINPTNMMEVAKSMNSKSGSSIWLHRWLHIARGRFLTRCKASSTAELVMA